VHTGVIPRLRIRLFGKLNLLVGEESIDKFRTRTVGWIFAYLVLHHDRSIRRDDVIEALWPDAEDPYTTRQTLRRQLAFLRQALGEEAYRLSSPTKSTLRLDLTGAFVDYFAFEDAIKTGDLARAITLFTGDFLQECGALWALLIREECRVYYLNALIEVARQAIHSCQPETAIPYLQRCFKEDRSQEEVAQDLMETYSATNAYTDAIQVYRELRSELARKYDTCPQEKTTAKYREVLKAFSDQKRVHRGPSAQATSPVGTVPAMLVRLIGRKRAVSEVLGHLEQTPLITLTGTGGIGKSQLALQIAHLAWPDYPDGVWFVDLLNVRTPEFLISEIAAVLGQPHEETPGEQTLLRFLKSKWLLLVLDNCEHLIPHCTRLARHILQECPYVRILATSRQSLRLRGEQNWRVPPLDLPPLPPAPIWEETDPVTLSEVLLHYEAVELFVERARQAWQEFALTPANARTIARICHRLEGIPLAIDLAAAWVGDLPLEAIENHLEDRFGSLTEGDPSGPAHHQALRTTLDWSYNAFAPEEQILWKALSIFSGEWSREATEAVCNPFPTKQSLVYHLDQLVERSVVLQTAPCGETHYHMLETLRDYGRTKLEETPDYVATLRTRHLEYFLGLALRLTASFTGGEEDGIKQMNRARADFRTALEWAEQTRDGESGLRLVSALWRLWNQRGEYGEGYRWLDAMLLLAPNSDSMVRLKAIGAAGNLAYRRGDNANAHRWFKAHLDLACLLDRPRAMASAFGNLGNVATLENRLADAQDGFERSLALFQKLDDTRGIALAKSNLAIVACRQSDFVCAYQYHTESIALFRKQGDRLNLATALANYAETRLCAGEGAASASTLEESLQTSYEIGYMRTVAQCLCLYLSLARRLSLLLDAGILIGISEIWRERDVFVISPQSLPRFEEDRTTTQSMLDPDAYQQAIRQGRALSEEEAVEQMLLLGKKIVSMAGG
jgi:predicted ATPase/DNA-binding SARP family transcriptional activator